MMLSIANLNLARCEFSTKIASPRARAYPTVAKPINASINGGEYGHYGFSNQHIFNQIDAGISMSTSPFGAVIFSISFQPKVQLAFPARHIFTPTKADTSFLP